MIENALASLPALGALRCENGTGALIGGWQGTEEKEFQKESETPVPDMMRKLRLHVPDGDEPDGPRLRRRKTDWLDESEMHDVHRKQNSEDTAAVRAIYAEGGEWGGHQPLVDQLRAALFDDFPNVLRESILPDPPIRGPNCEAQIYLKPTAQPKKQRCMSMCGERLGAMEQITQDWLEAGKIESCNGPWSSPCFPVGREGKAWRGVVDLRYMNDQCLEDSYPLPRIDEILVKQGRKHIHSVLDLKDAFHQIPMRKESRHITGTVTPKGLFQWKVVVMGWKNGVQYCQRNLETALAGVCNIASGYVDDILMGSSKADPDEDVPTLLMRHDQEVREVLKALEKAKMVASRRKAQFFQKAVEFCGHLLKDGQRGPIPGKLLAIQKWELPKTITSLRGFLGFCNYYSGYVADFARLVIPLQEKLKVPKADAKKGSTVKVKWDEEAMQAFEDTKKALMKGLSLQNVRVDQPFVLRVDASGRAIGAALEQVRDGLEASTIDEVLNRGATVPVGFMSRKLTDSQVRTWDIRDKECYAIISALEKWAGWVGSNLWSS